VALAIKAQLADVTIDDDPAPSQTDPRREAHMTQWLAELHWSGHL
jgi:hypothetical protein